MQDFIFWTGIDPVLWILLGLLLLSLSLLVFMQVESTRSKRKYAELFQQSERANSEIEQLKLLAFSDYLTGLPNRVSLETQVQAALAIPRKDHQFLVAFLDLDNFKEINDTFGHEVGDEVLRVVATRLQCTTRPSDTIARLGGDEFIIFAHMERRSDGDAIIAKIMDIFLAPVTLRGQRIFIKASIGNAIFPDDGLSLDGLLAAADQHMYSQKRAKQLSLSL